MAPVASQRRAREGPGSVYVEMRMVVSACSRLARACPKLPFSENLIADRGNQTRRVAENNISSRKSKFDHSTARTLGDTQTEELPLV
jgi:hypothetical protein